MGKGKGAVSFWSQMAPTGASLFEGTGPSRDILARAVNGVKKKIPCRAGMFWVKTKFHK
jgi:ribosomal protein L16/L10AE